VSRCLTSRADPRGQLGSLPFVKQRDPLAPLHLHGRCFSQRERERGVERVNPTLNPNPTLTLGGGCRSDPNIVRFHYCFTPEDDEWGCARTEIERRIDKRGTHPTQNKPTVRLVPTHYAEFEEVHKRVSAAVTKKFPLQINQRNTATAGLSQNDSRKHVMETYRSLRNQLVAKTTGVLRMDLSLIVAGVSEAQGYTASCN